MKALHGEFESTAAIHAIVGAFTPKPIAWGSFKSIPNAHYYICKFYELAEEVPEPNEFCRKVAYLHSKSEAPNGKFGFHIVTYNGDLPQENGYASTWEEFFVNGFKHMVNLNVERGGPWQEMDDVKEAMYQKVIPRLLRPMETAGRSVKPSLVHGDLWCGNAAVDALTDRPLIYDPASFYAHNECKWYRHKLEASTDPTQMSLVIGVQSVISSLASTSMHTIPTSPKPIRRKTMMIAMHCTRCRHFQIIYSLAYENLHAIGDSTCRLLLCSLTLRVSENRELLSRLSSTAPD